MEQIVIKKVVPPVEGTETRNKVVKEGLDMIIKTLKEKGYLTCTEEPIDDYVILTFKVSEPSQPKEIKSQVTA